MLHQSLTIDNGILPHPCFQMFQITSLLSLILFSKWMVGYLCHLSRVYLKFLIHPAVNYSSRNTTTSRQSGVSPKTTETPPVLPTESWILIDMFCSTWIDMDSLKIWEALCTSLVGKCDCTLWNWRYASFEFWKLSNSRAASLSFRR